jgi:CheY-like chemotaxis protein
MDDVGQVLTLIDDAGRARRFRAHDALDRDGSTYYLVEAMDGAMSVESVSGKGSTFRFNVKMEAVESMEKAAFSAHSEPNEVDADAGAVPEAEVLLVDDNFINQEIAVELLRYKTENIDVVNNGAEAVEAAERKRYDLIFMDIQMPVMDGLEAARRIRAIPGREAERLPIIAMTAHAMQGDYDKSLAAGMNDHITKPLDVAELYRVFHKWASVGISARETSS